MTDAEHLQDLRAAEAETCAVGRPQCCLVRRAAALTLIRDAPGPPDFEVMSLAYSVFDRHVAAGGTDLVGAAVRALEIADKFASVPGSRVDLRAVRWSARITSRNVSEGEVLRSIGYRVAAPTVATLLGAVCAAEELAPDEIRCALALCARTLGRIPRWKPSEIAMAAAMIAMGVERIGDPCIDYIKRLE